MTHRFVEPGHASAEFFEGIDSVPAMLWKRAALTPAAEAYFTQGSDGRWISTTWSEFREQVVNISGELVRHGIKPGTRVGILARTCVGWESVQMAALACGAVVVGIDPYYSDTLINELLGELDVRCLFVENAETLQRLSADCRVRLTFVALIRSSGAKSQDNYTTLEELCDSTGDALAGNPLAKGQETAIVAFSSGSTGQPKPILYTHAQVVHACRCLLALYPELSAETRLVCWLPLANLFQRMINFCAIAKGATSFMVEDPRGVMEVLPVANPEIFIAVPRFCEKLHAGMMQRIKSRPWLERLVEHSIRLGGALRESTLQGIRIPPIKRAAAHVADRLVLARLRAVMGRNIRFIVCGSAPISRRLLARFEALGIPIVEAYGVSENLVPVCANRLSARKAGTVGTPVGDNDVRVAPDGEVQVRGSGVFMPSLAGNHERAHVITEDGFLATGDLGALDAEGFLTLRGRRTEAFKNAQGRWVSLTVIEDTLRQVPDVEHAAVVRMPQDRLIGILALANGPGVVSGDSDFKDRLSSTLSLLLQQHLASLPNGMRPSAFLVVRAGFTPATGELTTNLKLRRAAITERYAEPLRELTAALGSSSTRANNDFLLRFL